MQHVGGGKNRDQKQPDLQPSLIGDNLNNAAGTMETVCQGTESIADEKTKFPSFFQRFMHKHFPEARAHDRWTLLFTAVIAVSTALYTLFAFWTLREIHSGGADTHTLAIAAATQASHTREIAQAAQEQVDAADKISDAANSFSATANVAVEEFKRAAAESAAASREAASNAKNTIKNAQTSFRDDQRAWVGIGPFRVAQFEEQKPLEVDVEILNSGKTPALRVEEWARYKFSSISQLGPMPTELADIKWTPEGSVPPQGHQTLHLDLPWDVWKKNELAIKFKRSYPAFFGVISYNDISGRQHRTQFCFYMKEPETHSLAFCDQWNDMD